MGAAVVELLQQLDLERIEENIFRGISPHRGWKRVFGGHVIAQALVAAEQTVSGRAPHSLHAYFILPGDPAVPIVYQVARLRDGNSFSTRRCDAIQHGQAIFSLLASFQREEDGLSHQVSAPEVPDPEGLPSDRELSERFAALLPPEIKAFFARERAIEIRPTSLRRYSAASRAVSEPSQSVWLRAAERLPDDPAIHRAFLAYLSDMTLLDTALIAHGRSIFDKDIQVASLDHALWFHRPFRADEWLLYVQDSPNSGGARGLTRGQIFSASGTLVASVSQEGLIRRRSPRPDIA